MLNARLSHQPAKGSRVPARNSLDRMEEISVGDAERGALGHNKIGLRRRNV